MTYAIFFLNLLVANFSSKNTLFLVTFSRNYVYNNDYDNTFYNTSLIIITIFLS